MQTAVGSRTLPVRVSEVHKNKESLEKVLDVQMFIHANLMATLTIKSSSVHCLH